MAIEVNESVSTRFIIREGRTATEFLILCDDAHSDWERLENVKTTIRQKRWIEERKRIQSYSAVEVAEFLIQSTQIY